MKIRIICVGRLKERFWEDASNEYKKRLSKFAEIEITELPDEKTSHDPSPSEIERVKALECARISEKLSQGEFVTALDPKGRMLSSEELADTLSGIMLEGNSRITFVIGGSHGLTEDMKKRADMTLSFSKLTFPHQLFRVMLLEQLFRSFKIINGEPYHK